MNSYLMGVDSRAHNAKERSRFPLFMLLATFLLGSFSIIIWYFHVMLKSCQQSVDDFSCMFFFIIFHFGFMFWLPALFLYLLVVISYCIDKLLRCLGFTFTESF
jgi:hypothetical protein